MDGVSDSITINLGNPDIVLMARPESREVQIIVGAETGDPIALDPEQMRQVLLTDEGVERVEKALAINNLYDPHEIETLHHVEQALRAHTLYKRDTHYMVRDGQVIIIDEFTGRTLAAPENYFDLSYWRLAVERAGADS